LIFDHTVKPQKKHANTCISLQHNELELSRRVGHFMFAYGSRNRYSSTYIDAT